MRAARNTDPPPGLAVDDQVFGRLVRAARIAAGASTVAHGAVDLRAAGLEISDRALAALERGEVRPSLATLLIIVVTFRPPGGVRFFAPCLRADLRELLGDQ